MYGATGKGKPYYRCPAIRPGYAAPAVSGHPPTYMVREERIVDVLDRCLSALVAPTQFEATVADVLAPIVR